MDNSLYNELETFYKFLLKEREETSNMLNNVPPEFFMANVKIGLELAEFINKYKNPIHLYVALKICTLPIIDQLEKDLLKQQKILKDNVK